MQLLREEGLSDYLEALDTGQKNWAESQGFKAGAGEVCLLPDGQGNPDCAMVGLGAEE
ncbi:MAG TPA: leucyl aminopeptidase family protein, partial [Gammaproteobacteria bacterium]|nr:leucyl aminopeptidase family protein [Gammaproteobacteria bacterium]